MEIEIEMVNVACKPNVYDVTHTIMQMKNGYKNDIEYSTQFIRILVYTTPRDNAIFFYIYNFLYAINGHTIRFVEIHNKNKFTNHIYATTLSKI